MKNKKLDGKNCLRGDSQVPFGGATAISTTQTTTATTVLAPCPKDPPLHRAGLVGLVLWWSSVKTAIHFGTRPTSPTFILFLL